LEKGLTESASQIDGTVPTNTAVVLSKCLLGALHSSSDVEEKVVLDFANNAVATAGGQIYQITFTPHLIKDTYDTLVLPHLAQIKLHNLENPYIPEEKQNTEFVQDTEDYIQFIEDRGTRFPETISNLIDSHGRKSLFQTVILTGGGLVLAYVSTGPAAPFTVGSMFSLENCVLNIVSNDDFNGLLVALAKSHGEESIGYAEGISSALSYIKRKIESGDYEFPKIVVDLPGKGTISIGNKFQKPLKVRVFSHTLMGPKQAVGVCPKNKFDFYSRYQDAELQPGDHLQFFSYMLTDSGQDELDKWLVSMAAEGYEEVGTETVYYVNYGEGALQAMKEIRAGCSTIPAGCSGMVSDKVCPQGCLYRDVDCGTSSTETICGKKDSVCPSSCGENNDPDCCKPPSNWVEGYGCCPQGGTCGTLGNCFMQCPDKCDGKKRLFNGEQNTGCTECEYKEEDCGYECSEGKCVSKPTTYGPPQSQKDLTIQNVKISKGKPIEVSADILVPNDFKKQLEQTAIYASDIYPYVINIKAEVYKKSCFLFICKQDKEVYQKTFNYLSCGTGCLTRIDDMEFPNNFEKELTEINEPGDYYVKLSLVQTVPYASAGGPLSEKDQAISESVSDNFRIEGIPVTGQVTKVSGEPTWWQKVFGLFS
jgi:hypothetical protein